ncbi:hypothetical protein DFJ43DRAFT_1042038 [Lentinula guzmanii]|uniref:Uncharacterized protein n=1 Tax=Lentinula guzmanii TaxID=2804957 RepID=A0AA38J5H5_9AGAR|nr:hypothetical protein DFJ43DRAFT_1042038 [Lentinula guzmanii]
MGELGVYANEDMNAYTRLQSRLDPSWQRNWGTVFLEPNRASGLVDIEQQTEWSKVFRIGTQSSASYLDQISNELARLVEQTSLEDLPVANPKPSHIQHERVHTQSRNRNSSRHDSSHPGSRNPSDSPASRIPDRPPSTNSRARPGGSNTLTRNSQSDRRAPSRPLEVVHPLLLEAAHPLLLEVVFLLLLEVALLLLTPAAARAILFAAVIFNLVAATRMTALNQVDRTNTFEE